MSKIEEKLFQNRYRVDEGRPHISIINKDVCATKCRHKACTFICPAACYALEDTGHVALTTDGCLECGTCRVVCQDNNNIDWWYPRGGFGVLFKFG